VIQGKSSKDSDMASVTYCKLWRGVSQVVR